MKFRTDDHGPQRMNPNIFGDPQIFFLLHHHVVDSVGFLSDNSELFELFQLVVIFHGYFMGGLFFKFGTNTHASFMREY